MPKHAVPRRGLNGPRSIHRLREMSTVPMHEHPAHNDGESCPSESDAMSERPYSETPNDWVHRPGPGFVWWCLPLVVGLAANFFTLSPRTTTTIWMVSFVWMGTGCILNARRCHRLHCYISGPAFLLGAAALGLFAAGITVLGPPHSPNNIVGVTLSVALLSFVPEMIWRKYA